MQPPLPIPPSNCGQFEANPAQLTSTANTTPALTTQTMCFVRDQPLLLALAQRQMKPAEVEYTLLHHSWVALQTTSASMVLVKRPDFVVVETCCASRCPCLIEHVPLHSGWLQDSGESRCVHPNSCLFSLSLLSCPNILPNGL